MVLSLVPPYVRTAGDSLFSTRPPKDDVHDKLGGGIVAEPDSASPER